jgi:phosphatidylserine decarboxylase
MFGSRVDLFLPVEVQPRVAKGERVVAGVSVVAQAPVPA